MEQQRFCRACEKPLTGRSDKKFCDAYCKSAFHYKNDRNGNNFYQKVERQLKKNRKLLKAFNKAGKATVRAEILIAQGDQQAAILRAVVEEYMGIDWMTLGELSEAIPPAYSEFIGRAAIEHINSQQRRAA